MGMMTSIKDGFESYEPKVSLGYFYDAEHNLEKMENNVQPMYSLSSLEYDGLNRLTDGFIGDDIIDIRYNPNNDITYKKVGNQSLTYAYNDTTHLLAGISGSQNRSFAHDKRGNVISNGLRSFTFNEANQMTGSGDNMIFIYDGFGNRVSKQYGSQKEYFMYSRNGKLMYKATDNTDDFTSYYYLENQLVAKNNNSTPNNLAWLPAILYLLH